MERAIKRILMAFNGPYPGFPRLLGSAETIALWTISLTTLQASILKHNWEQPEFCTPLNTFLGRHAFTFGQ
jgi:hypothetical protein